MYSTDSMLQHYFHFRSSFQSEYLPSRPTHVLKFVLCFVNFVKIEALFTFYLKQLNNFSK